MICFVMLSLSACKSSIRPGDKMSNSEMEQLVKELNKNCPINYKLLSATSYACEGKDIVIEYVMDEDKIVYSNLTDSALYNIWRLCCLDEVSPTDKDIFKSIVASGYGLKCNFKGSMSQKKMTLDVSNEKLKNNKPITQEEIIATLVAIDRNGLPKDVDRVTKIVDFKAEKENLIYVYEIDETSFDISQIESNGQYKENGMTVIGNELRYNTLTGVLYRQVALSGRGICHRYIGKSSGKVVDVQFSNAELRQIADQAGL